MFPEEASFNGLTPAEAERLALLIEEAAEVQQIATKILRHGFNSYHPDDPTRKTNRELLQAELTDLAAAQLLMLLSKDVQPIDPKDLIFTLSRKARFLHHQEVRL